MLLDGKRMKNVRPAVEKMLDLVGLKHRGKHKPDHKQCHRAEYDQRFIATRIPARPRIETMKQKHKQSY